jgi:ubiquinone biosynthesis protein COQ9
MSDAPVPDIDRDAIIRAILPHVAFEGWPAKAVNAGLADLGLPREAARLAFPGGAVEMIRHWSAMLDRQMEEAMAAAADELALLAPPERIARAVRLRLDACRADREAVRRAIAYLALPPSQPAALRITYETIDAIWYAAGDRSTDFSYYTRRATLTAVYTATVMFWLDDYSEDSEATWAFLGRRLNDVGRVHRLRRRLSAALSGLASPLAMFRPRRNPAVEMPPASDPYQAN